MMLAFATIASLRFAGSMEPGWVVLIALVLSIGAGLYYLRETRHLSGPAAYGLPAIRSAAIFLVVLVLAGPVWHRESTVGVLGRVIFAIDTSASMSTTDSSTANEPNRIQRITDRLIGAEGVVIEDSRGNEDEPFASDAGWLELLRETHHIDVLAFDEGPARVVWTSGDESGLPDTLHLTADGRSTDLSTPMQYVRSAVAGSDETNLGDDQTPPTALVILSDGRDTAVSRSSGAGVTAGALSVSSGSVVHALGFGSLDEPVDVGITDVIAPETVAVDGRMAGTIRYKQVGSSDPVKIRIETSEGETVWQGESSSGDGGAVDFEMDVAALLESIAPSEDRGVVRTTLVMDLRAVIDTGAQNGSITQNDVRPFRVAAAVRDRRILIADGSSRWEVRYLRNLFQRDPSYQVDTVIFGAGTDQNKVIRGDQPGQFPDTDTAMNRYDAVVLGELPPEQWTQADAARLDQFVSRGGGLVVIDGRYDRIRSLSQGPLSELVPVEISSRPVANLKSVAPSTLAGELPLFDLTGAAGDIQSLWKALPVPSQTVRTRPKPGAEVWLETETADGETFPFLVTRMFGSGRVFYFASDQTWRWRYKVADQFHARFWNQLFSAAMQPPYAASDDFVALASDKIEYAVGETPIIRTRLRDASGIAVGDATVDAIISADGEVVTTVPMEVDNALRGTYRGVAAALDPGRYEIKIRAGGFDTRALRASMPFWVGSRPSNEWSRLSLDADNLKRIASDGGGLYLPESSADEILESLRPLSTGRIIRTDHALWQSFWWFAAILALLAVEWFWRKRSSLV